MLHVAGQVILGAFERDEAFFHGMEAERKKRVGGRGRQLIVVVGLAGAPGMKALAALVNRRPAHDGDKTRRRRAHATAVGDTGKHGRDAQCAGRLALWLYKSGV